MTMGKTEERAAALAARRVLTAKERQIKSAAICRRLRALPELGRAQVLLSYMAAWDEADLSLLHEALLAEGKTLAFPVTGPEGRMEAWTPSGPGAMKKGRFGLLEPDRTRARQILPGQMDIVLVPCVAFDSACMRLGHGAGYYDRYLPGCSGALLIGLAFEEQRLPRVTAMAHDRAMDLIVTDGGIYR